MKLRLLILVMVVGVAAVIAGWVYESRLRPQALSEELEVPDNIDYFLVLVTYDT